MQRPLICNPTSADRALQGNTPQCEFQTFSWFANSFLIVRDQKIVFTRAYKFFWLASNTATFNNADLWVHLFPLVGWNGPNYTNPFTNVYAPTGGEPWLPIALNATSTAIYMGRFFRFRYPVQQFYITLDHGNGVAQQTLTFGASNDIEDADLVTAVGF